MSLRSDIVAPSNLIRLVADYGELDQDRIEISDGGGLPTDIVDGTITKYAGGRRLGGFLNLSRCVSRCDPASATSTRSTIQQTSTQRTTDLSGLKTWVTPPARRSTGTALTERPVWTVDRHRDNGGMPFLPELWKSRRQRRGSELRPLPWLPATASVLVAVVGGGLVALWLLNSWAGRHQGGMGAEAGATLRLDAIKTALTVAAGLGAGVTLIVALRRQSISERSQRHVEEDAREQRITTLYVAAAEQLGSEKAAVRLAGLYALERLGQDNPKLRQTVVDVICAYLRMPYTPPAEALRGNAQHSPYALGKGDPDPEPEQQPGRRQELQVRLTAQRLIEKHLWVGYEPDAPEPPTYWRGPAGERMNLDLEGAVLVGFSLASCRLEAIDLTRAHLLGSTLLHGAQFYGDARLAEVQFHDIASLGGAQFHETLDLQGAQFYGPAGLREAQFHESAYLHKAQFYEKADMVEAQFHADTHLSEAQFHENATQFYAEANLGEVQFFGKAELSGVRFQEMANLSAAQFHAGTNLLTTQFRGNANLSEVLFYGSVDLRDAQFHKSLNLTGARATEQATLPPGWTLAPDTSERLHLIVRARAATDATASPRATET